MHAILISFKGTKINTYVDNVQWVKITCMEMICKQYQLVSNRYIHEVKIGISVAWDNKPQDIWSQKLLLHKSNMHSTDQNRICDFSD